MILSLLISRLTSTVLKAALRSRLSIATKLLSSNALGIRDSDNRPAANFSSLAISFYRHLLKKFKILPIATFSFFTSLRKSENPGMNLELSPLSKLGTKGGIALQSVSHTPCKKMNSQNGLLKVIKLLTKFYLSVDTLKNTNA